MTSPLFLRKLLFNPYRAQLENSVIRRGNYISIFNTQFIYIVRQFKENNEMLLLLQDFAVLALFLCKSVLLVSRLNIPVRNDGKNILTSNNIFVYSLTFCVIIGHGLFCTILIISCWSGVPWEFALTCNFYFYYFFTLRFKFVTVNLI